MVVPFITDMGEKLELTDTKTGEKMVLDQYAYWCDMGKGKPEVKETSDDLKSLMAKYDLSKDKVIDMRKYKHYLQEKSRNSMNEITKFRNVVRECISELKKENDPRERLKESLRKVVKDVLNEVGSLTNRGLPEQDKEEKEISDKQYNKKGNVRLDKNNEAQQHEMETLAHSIDPKIDVYWDDHNQLIVCDQNNLYVRICQRFENSYDIDAMVKLVDRVRAIAQTWDQVKAFVKANFGDLKKTIPDQKHDMAIDNTKDREVIKTAPGPMTGVIKNRGEKKNGEDAKIKSTKRDDQDYNEPMTKRDEDMPDQPMKKVTEPGKDPEGKNKKIDKTQQPKAPKHTNDNTLRTKDKKTSKFVLKQKKASPSEKKQSLSKEKKDY